MRRSKDPSAARRVSLTQICVEVGWDAARTKRFLRQHPTWAKPRGFPPTYDARVIDLIHELRNKQHRSISPEDNWLDRYLGGDHLGTT